MPSWEQGGFFVFHDYEPRREVDYLKGFDRALQIEMAAWNRAMYEFEHTLQHPVLYYQIEMLPTGELGLNGKSLVEMTDSSLQGGRESIESLKEISRMFRTDNSIKTAVFHSPDIGYGRDYVYVFERNNANGIIEARAFEYKGDNKSRQYFQQSLIELAGDNKLPTDNVYQPVFSRSSINTLQLAHIAEQSYRDQQTKNQFAEYRSRLAAAVVHEHITKANQQERIENIQQMLNQKILRSQAPRDSLHSVYEEVYRWAFQDEKMRIQHDTQDNVIIAKQVSTPSNVMIVEQKQNQISYTIDERNNKPQEIPERIPETIHNSKVPDVQSLHKSPLSSVFGYYDQRKTNKLNTVLLDPSQNLLEQFMVTIGKRGKPSADTFILNSEMDVNDTEQSGHIASDMAANVVRDKQFPSVPYSDHGTPDRTTVQVIQKTDDFSGQSVQRLDLTTRIYEQLSRSTDVQLKLDAFDLLVRLLLTDKTRVKLPLYQDVDNTFEKALYELSYNNKQKRPSAFLIHQVMKFADAFKTDVIQLVGDAVQVQQLQETQKAVMPQEAIHTIIALLFSDDKERALLISIIKQQDNNNEIPLLASAVRYLEGKMQSEKTSRIEFSDMLLTEDYYAIHLRLIVLLLVYKEILAILQSCIHQEKEYKFIHDRIYSHILELLETVTASDSVHTNASPIIQSHYSNDLQHGVVFDYKGHTERMDLWYH